MNDDALAEWSYLWDGSQEGWMLLKNPEGGFSIYNMAGHVLLIESNETAKAVCQKLLEKGVPILDDLPPGGEAVAKPVSEAG